MREGEKDGERNGDRVGLTKETNGKIGRWRLREKEIERDTYNTYRGRIGQEKQTDRKR